MQTSPSSPTTSEPNASSNRRQGQDRNQGTKTQTMCEVKFGRILDNGGEGRKEASSPQRFRRRLQPDLFPAVGSCGRWSPSPDPRGSGLPPFLGENLRHHPTSAVDCARNALQR